MSSVVQNVKELVGTLNCFNHEKHGPCRTRDGKVTYPPTGSCGKMFSNHARISSCHPTGGTKGVIAALTIGSPVSMATSFSVTIISPNDMWKVCISGLHRS